MHTIDYYESFSFLDWWNRLRPTYISFYFIGFVFIVILLYYIMPKKTRWIVLLVASIIFYSIAGLYPLIVICLTTIITWGIGLSIEYISAEKKKHRRFMLLLGISVILCMLIYCKVYNYLSLQYGFIIPLGISYYSFSSIGYLTDIYRGNDKAEKNYFKLLLFILFFPKILEGPISKHRRIGPQLTEGHSFDHQSMVFGIQRMTWGFFKKLVIADHLSPLVNEVFGNYQAHFGSEFVIATLFGVVQLYCDFSGCMDIALGISECLGIHMEENFQQPFASRTAAEFWRRWHISLGAWFTDYIYKPLIFSPALIKASKKIRGVIGKRAGKHFLVIVPLIIVWFFTGVWHGTSINYILWGLYWGSIIILSNVLDPEIKKMTKILKINPKSYGFILFQKCRTLLLFAFSRIITIPDSFSVSWYAIKSIFTNFAPWKLLDGSIYTLGLDNTQLIISLLAIVLVGFIGSKKEKGIHIRKWVTMKPFLIRVMIYYAILFAVLVFGAYGPGYSTSSFVYMRF